MAPNLTNEWEAEAWVLTPVPEHFVRVVNDGHAQCSPGYILYWLKTDPFLDANTGLHFLGPNGIRVGILLVLRILISLVRMQPEIQTYIPLYGRLYLQEILLYMRQSAIALSAQIKESLVTVRGRRQSISGWPSPPCALHCDYPGSSIAS
ncbi:hypothetical protein FRC08_014946, partial [Ceratobasidium sp. 394]